ncbi:GNAT family N-acetyltransferase [Glycomyces tarimensis]
MEAQTIKALQERAARAMPAERVETAGGWLLRHAPRCSWWVGTVLPHGGVEDLESSVAAAERFYADRGERTRFQITPGVCAEGLDALLDDRGYRRSGPISLRASPTAAVRERLGPSPLRATVEDRLRREWFDTWLGVHGTSGDVGAEWDLLGRVAAPSGYARAFAGDQAVAVGRAVADDGWAGVYGMATPPPARGKGAARSVLAALADWAGANGAEWMFLQVESDNFAAMRLYERAGFAEVGAYHYRLRPG